MSPCAQPTTVFPSSPTRRGSAKTDGTPSDLVGPRPVPPASSASACFIVKDSDGKALAHVCTTRRSPDLILPTIDWIGVVKLPCQVINDGNGPGVISYESKLRVYCCVNDCPLAAPQI